MICEIGEQKIFFIFYSDNFQPSKIIIPLKRKINQVALCMMQINFIYIYIPIYHINMYKYVIYLSDNFEGLTLSISLFLIKNILPVICQGFKYQIFCCWWCVTSFLLLQQNGNIQSGI